MLAAIKSKLFGKPQIQIGKTEVDWSNWSPPGENDVRSPCPALNALANHSIIPHNGKGITKEVLVKALTNPNTIHLHPDVAALLAAGGIATNPDHHAHFIDLDKLDKHNFIEHDASLSRQDIAFGSTSAFDQEQWAKIMEVHAEGGATMTSYESASKARYKRVLEAKERHEIAGKEFTYGIKQVFLSYGETAFYLGVLGSHGKVSLEYLKVFFEEARFPWKEGWKPPANVIDQGVMTKTIFDLMAANEHKAEEAMIAGVGTVEFLKKVIGSLLTTTNYM